MHNADAGKWKIDLPAILFESILINLFSYWKIIFFSSANSIENFEIVRRINKFSLININNVHNMI